MQKATNWAALLGFLTALSGLLQVMWTTTPWWKKDKAVEVVTVSKPPRPHHANKGGYPPMAGEPVAETMSSERKVRFTQWGYYLIVIGVVAGLSAGGYKLVVRLRARKGDDPNRFLA
jgi:hypothetical protein